MSATAAAESGGHDATHYILHHLTYWKVGEASGRFMWIHY